MMDEGMPVLFAAFCKKGRKIVFTGKTVALGEN
jgi:hypothetical protein